MSTSVRVTAAMVNAFDDAYSKNWEAQRLAPEGAQELGTFFATRAGLEAALSAQPSPGGQGARSLLAAEYDAAGSDKRATLIREGRDHAPSTSYALRAIEAALAARQPVGEPVGQVRTRVDGGFIAELFPGVADRVSNFAPLYAAPPAQAVDLGAVRALLQRRIEQWRSHLPADQGAPGTREIETKGEHDYNNDVRILREGIAVMEEVLSKIDSKAVGNG